MSPSFYVDGQTPRSIVSAIGRSSDHGVFESSEAVNANASNGPFKILSPFSTPPDHILGTSPQPLVSPPIVQPFNGIRHPLYQHPPPRSSSLASRSSLTYVSPPSRRSSLVQIPKPRLRTLLLFLLSLIPIFLLSLLSLFHLQRASAAIIIDVDNIIDDTTLSVFSGSVYKQLEPIPGGAVAAGNALHPLLKGPGEGMRYWMTVTFGRTIEERDGRIRKDIEHVWEIVGPTVRAVDGD